MADTLWLPAFYPREGDTETNAFIRNRKTGTLRFVGDYPTRAEAERAAWAASDALALAHQTKRASGRRPKLK